MREDLSVFSDETLATLYEDLLDFLDDGLDTKRTRVLLHRISVEQARRFPPWERQELAPTGSFLLNEPLWECTRGSCIRRRF